MQLVRQWQTTSTLACSRKAFRGYAVAPYQGSTPAGPAFKLGLHRVSEAPSVCAGSGVWVVAAAGRPIRVTYLGYGYLNKKDQRMQCHIVADYYGRMFDTSLND